MFKLLKNPLYLGITALAIGVIVVVILAIPNTSHAYQDYCKNKIGVTHQVEFKGDYASPEITNGHMCDKITFTNKDHETREIAFGPHENHQAYDGVTEKILNYNQSFTITLNKIGTYDFHDHIHDNAIGNFIVTK